jgi:pyrroloquinoline-quinone synthase
VSADDRLAEDAFEARLREIGERHYHHRHPFNQRMHEGTLRPEEIRTWVANRYYYQTRIPIKDGLILAKAQDPDFRRDWVQRIHDHDGLRPGEGGLSLWLALADAVGLERERVQSLRDVLPGVRRACDAYVAFVESHDLLESVAASLTELFAGGIMATRIAAFEEHYPWVETQGLRYFRTRTSQAPADAAFGLAFVKREARTRADQERCAGALLRKCEILWSLLDAVEAAHARPEISPDALARLDDDEPMIVLSERAVKLGGSGREIARLCDGTRTSVQVVDELSARHPDQADLGTLAADVHDFIGEMVRLQAFRWAS